MRDRLRPGRRRRRDGRRPGAGHPVDPRHRRGHRLRAAARRPVPGGTGRHGTGCTAMRPRWRRSVGAIVASAATVAARPARAAAQRPDQQPRPRAGRRHRHRLRRCSSTLTFLPAVLALLGRAAYWPRAPHTRTARTRPGTAIWERIAAPRRPASPPHLGGRLIVLVRVRRASCRPCRPKGVPLERDVRRRGALGDRAGGPRRALPRRLGQPRRRHRRRRPRCRR